MSRDQGRFDKAIGAFRRDENREVMQEKAREVARVIYATDCKGRPAATHSMVHEVPDARSASRARWYSRRTKSPPKALVESWPRRR